MADIKNFSLAGVAKTVQFGKRGASLNQASDAFAFRKLDNTFAVVEVASPTAPDHAATKKYVDDNVVNAVNSINTARIQDSRNSPKTFVGTAEVGALAGKVVIAADSGTAATTVATFQSGANANANLVVDNATANQVSLIATGSALDVNLHLSPKGDGIVQIGVLGASSMMQADDQQSLTLAAGDNSINVGADLILRGGTGGNAGGSVIMQGGDGGTLVAFTGTNLATTNFEFKNGTNSVSLETAGVASNIDVVINPKGLGVLNVSTSRISNLVNPVDNQDAVTKVYADVALASAAAITVTNIEVAKIGSLQTRQFVLGSSNGNIGVPITGRVRRVMLQITQAYTAGSTINVGYTAYPGALIHDSEVDESQIGTYDINAVDMVLTNQQLIGFVSVPFGGSGSAKVVVEFIQG